MINLKTKKETKELNFLFIFFLSIYLVIHFMFDGLKVLSLKSEIHYLREIAFLRFQIRISSFNCWKRN